MALTENKAVLSWIDEMAKMTQPDKIVWIDGSQEQIDALRARVDEHTDKRHRCELQLQRVETEFKQIEERIWEDYEITYALAEPFRQADFRRDPVAKVGQYALAVHTLRGGGQAQEDLGLIVGQ